MSKRAIGELLVQDEIISVGQLAKAKEEQRRTGTKLSSALISLGMVKESQILDYVAQQFQIQKVNLADFEIEPEIISLVPADICRKHCIVPVTKSLETLVVACADPGNMFIRDDLTFLTQSKIEFVVAAEGAIKNAISRYYDTAQMGNIVDDLETSGAMGDTGEIALGETASQQEKEDEPIVKFVNLMMNEAIKAKASDIHIEPYEKKFRVRFRIDGRLQERIQPPQKSAKAITNRIKIMSGLDISEKRRPQDGRLKLRTSHGGEMEFRVSSIPSLFGEKIVMRLLDKSGLGKPLTEIGFEESDLRMVQEAISRPNGMVLVTGPTGSGKSTTVYSALNEINHPDINLCTAEDPVEMNLEGINHVQANPQIDLTFSAILRSFLRQDPDVIFVGEIRDLETAEVSFKAASTGHLVISTLHTNDAPATVVRLTEMGVAPYLVTATVSLIVAQRLLGRVCQSCSVPVQVAPESLVELGVPPDQVAQYRIVKGEGCSQCHGSGISGRIAIHEVLQMTSGVKEGILRGASSLELRKIAVAEGMVSLRQNALIKLRQGLTSIEEVINTTVKD